MLFVYIGKQKFYTIVYKLCQLCLYSYQTSKQDVSGIIVCYLQCIYVKTPGGNDDEASLSFTRLYLKWTLKHYPGQLTNMNTKFRRMTLTHSMVSYLHKRSNRTMQNFNQSFEDDDATHISISRNKLKRTRRWPLLWIEHMVND